jgi:hypothetical protein
LQVSGSTGSPDSCEPGKTVLECEQEALLSLNNKVALSGVALNVGLVTTFESDADASILTLPLQEYKYLPHH